MIVKESFYDLAVEIFQGSGISVMVDVKQHWGELLARLPLSPPLLKKE